MHITSGEIENYKSFKGPVRASFHDGINLLIGKNNSGKSTLLDFLSLSVPATPHRSLKSLPSRLSSNTSPVRGLMSVVFSPEELLDFVRHSGMNNAVRLPIPSPDSPFAQSLGYIGTPAEDDQKFLSWLLVNGLEFQLEFDTNAWHAPFPRLTSYPSPQLPFGTPPQYLAFRLTLQPDLAIRRENFGSATLPDLSPMLTQFIQKRLYLFRSSRLTTSNNNFSGNAGEELRPDCSNLTGVLDLLQRNHGAFEEYNSLVSRVLPEIKHVSVRYLGPGQGEIAIWLHERSTKRDDLAIPLSHAGSGVSHVLAMLYVFMSEQSQMILIDEPQSYLHPGALRSLIEVFKTSTRHQFIISTHSPTVITASDASSITLLRLIDGESNAVPVDPRDVIQARAYLHEIGASVADVFGAETVLWVEGATEEQCFPLIVRQVLNKSIFGTVIVGVVSTSELEAKRTRRIFEVYNRLSKGPGLLPVALGFLFDDELRSEDTKREMRKLADGKVHFLRRRMYENYLLQPRIIAELLTECDGGKSGGYAEADVQNWLDTNGNSPRYGKAPDFDPDRPWIEYVDAANLLEDLFTDLSDARMSYDKTTHSVDLTKRILATDPQEFQEVANTLGAMLGY